MQGQLALLYRQQSEPDSKAHERHRQRLCCRYKSGKRADEKSLGSTKIHALKAVTM